MALVPEHSQVAEPGGKVTKAAVITTGGAVLACAACCALPLALPIIGLAGAGAMLTAFGTAYRLLTYAGIGLVLIAWVWIAWQSRRTGKRPARATLRWLTVATILAGLAAAWPAIEPLAFRLLR